MLRRTLYPGLLLIFFALTFFACGSAEETATFHFEGEGYVEAESDGEERLLRAMEGGEDIAVRPSAEEDWDTIVAVDDGEYLVSGSSRAFRVRFPDGRILTRSHEESMSTGQTEPGTRATFEDWDRVDDLGTIVFGPHEPQRGDARSRSPLAGLFLLAVGTLSALKPEIAFFLDLGWRLRSAEPSEAYLVITRVVGFVMIAVGMLLLIAP